jgi:hypothetical protein
MGWSFRPSTFDPRPALALAVLAGAIACARIEAPPGGPPDTAPPRVLATIPDSLAVLPGFDGEVEFRFGEVVSEGSTPNDGRGTGDLERLILLSPDSQVPHVAWRRTRITVRPRGGWRPNTVYRVELLPGLLDLRRNRSDSGRVVTFTTGAPLPTAGLSGRIGDWTTGRAAGRALVEAVLLPDSLPYRAVADSTGRFRIAPLPSGDYLLLGVVDQNNDRRRQPREIWDSVRVASGDTAPAHVWAFPRDSAGPRIQGVAPRDSVTATVTFTQYLDPAQRLDTSAVRVLLLPDSTPVPVITLLPRAEHDSVHAPRAAPDTPAAADSLEPAPVVPAARDSAPRPPRRVAPAPDRAGPPAAAVAPPDGFTRPPLQKELVLRVGRAFEEQRSYVVQVAGVRNANGVAADVTGGLAMPARPKPAPADTAAKPDSPAVPARRDSTPR